MRTLIPSRRTPNRLLRGTNRFCRDERGQGMIFAAAGLLVLVGFVALVYNVGRLTERRTKIQMAADAAAYSGAMVQANSLSTIAWINSAMAQIYATSLKYAVDVNVAAVAAKMEMRMNQYPAAGGPVPPAVADFQDVVSSRQEALRDAKRWMADLSRIANSIAILTPRLVEEEMFAVAARAGATSEQPAVERVSLYPSYRMFPLSGQTASFLIEQFDNGWRITNLRGGNNEMVFIYLDGNEWHLQYTNNGITTQEVVVEEEDDETWRVRYYQPPGSLVQEILLKRTDGLGWVVWGAEGSEGTSEGDAPLIEFEPVDMDGDGEKEGTRVTIGDTSQVFMRGDDGDLYVWVTEMGGYVSMTTSQVSIGGVTVQINVTNVIRFPGGRAEIGDPTHVYVGSAHLVLSDPPTISTNLGPVRISIHGFDPDAFNISVGDFNLNHNNADGEWRKHYNRQNEYWWRHRLTEQEPSDPEALRQWQYDRELIGAHLRNETNMDRYVMQHAVPERFGNTLPAWMWTDSQADGWFNPMTGQPCNIGWRHQGSHFSDPNPTTGIRQLLAEYDPPEEAYYRTHLCTYCDGTGICPVCNGNDGNNDGVTDNGVDPFTPCATCSGTGICPACEALDHNRDGRSDVRIFLANLRDNDLENDYLESLVPGWTEYTEARMHTTGYGIDPAGYPLVLGEEFFQYGVNIGAWRPSDEGMLANTTGNSSWGFREPDWGYVAIASARVGIHDPFAENAYREHFDTRQRRTDWCDLSPYNLYISDLKARLYPCEEQIKEYDLDRDLLISASTTDIRESPLSYLWDAVLSTRSAYRYDNWLDRYDGRSDPQVGAALRNMRNRAGNRFDFTDEDLDDVVEH